MLLLLHVVWIPPLWFYTFQYFPKIDSSLVYFPLGIYKDSVICHGGYSIIHSENHLYSVRALLGLGSMKYPEEAVMSTNEIKL